MASRSVPKLACAEARTVSEAQCDYSAYEFENSQRKNLAALLSSRTPINRAIIATSHGMSLCVYRAEKQPRKGNLPAHRLLYVLLKDGSLFARKSFCTNVIQMQTIGPVFWLVLILMEPVMPYDIVP